MIETLKELYSILTDAQKKSLFKLQFFVVFMAFSEVIGTRYSVSTSTCTSALQMVLNYFNVAGYEVLVASASFITDVSVIKWCGATPIFVEMNPSTLSFDLDDLKSKITSRTKCVIWVHLTGIISDDYQEIINICKDNKLKLIEDCSHAHGSSVNGKNAGALGDVGCFSFYPGKIMTSGTGGMVTTNNMKLAAYVQSARLFGRCEGSEGKVCIEGNDWFMDEIRACVGYHQLLDLDENIKSRRKIAERYNQRLSSLSKFSLIKLKENNMPAYYQYAIILNKEVNRERLIKAMMSDYGIRTKRIYKPTHTEDIFSDLVQSEDRLMVTEDILSRSLCLPMYCQLSMSEVDYICDSLKSTLR